MKKLLKKMSNAVQNLTRKARRAVIRLIAPARPALAGSRGEGYVDTAVFS